MKAPLKIGIQTYLEQAAKTIDLQSKEILSNYQKVYKTVLKKN